MFNAKRMRALVKKSKRDCIKEDLKQVKTFIKSIAERGVNTYDYKFNDNEYNRMLRINKWLRWKGFDVEIIENEIFDYDEDLFIKQYKYTMIVKW